MKAKLFLADTAIAAAVLLGFMLISGVVNGEASVLPLIFAATGFFAAVLLNKRKSVIKRKVTHVNITDYSDCTHAA